jgi:predicted hotdog family 3-hydroxylacyl-ACP dehydratase
MTATARDKRWLDGHLPHRGRMNLLASVARWDDAGIRCVADSHRAPDNPLRRGGELPVACGIEYAAQAVAAHGALLAGDARPLGHGMLASVRSVAFGARRLDDVPGLLEVSATRIGAGTGGLLYEFRVESAGRELIQGRLAVVLEAPPRSPGGGSP